MKRQLAVAVLAVLGVLVWGSAAPAANVLELCIKPGGSVRAASSCTAKETAFKVVSEADFNALQTQVNALQTQVDAFEDQQAAIDALQTAVDGFTALLAGVSRPDAATLVLTGMNLQVVNGDGTTDGTNNGLGNIIVGYNVDNGDTRTGSHTVVIGDQHTWTSSAGLVAGVDNTLNGPYSFVGGGGGNTASLIGSFVGGGQFNTASGHLSFVGGGNGNTASGQSSFVGGGQGNSASGHSSFVGGGGNNASGDFAFVGGGIGNTASGQSSFVGGGGNNTAGPGTCGYVIAQVFGTC